MCLLIPAQSVGALAYPPTPTITSGLNSEIIFFAFFTLFNTLAGSEIFFIILEREIPLISRPSILYPAAGTFSISILPIAPTNNISVPGLICSTARAMAMAGKICPPVPPPLIIILSCCDNISCLLFYFSFRFSCSTNAQNHPNCNT